MAATPRLETEELPWRPHTEILDNLIIFLLIKTVHKSHANEDRVLKVHSTGENARSCYGGPDCALAYNSPAP